MSRRLPAPVGGSTALEEAVAPVGPAELPLVTVIMPVRNEASFIRRSLGAVLAQDYPADRLQVVVVDGDSDDGTALVASTLVDERRSQGFEDAPVAILSNPHRVVPSSLNLGLESAVGDVMVRVDGHCEIAPDYVRRCIEALGRHGAWCVGGPMQTIGHGWVGQAIARAQTCRFGVGGASFRTGTTTPRPVDTLAFGAYRREVFDRIGRFDEELVRNQDDEFNVRLSRAGGRIWLDPAIRSVYHSRAALRSLWRQYWEYGSYKVRVIQKHAGVATVRQLVPPLFIVGLGGSVGASLTRRTVAPLLAVAGSYAAANVAAAAWVTRGEQRLFPAVSAAFAVMHLAYGIGFLTGLWRWRRGFLRRDAGDTPRRRP